MRTNILNVIFGILFILLPMNAHAVLPGDLNGDGAVSIAEVQTVINAFLGLVPNQPGYAGIYKGTALVTNGGSGTIAYLWYVVDEIGQVTGSAIDATDNNRFYIMKGTVNLSTGIQNISFQLVDSHDTIAITGSPTSGTWGSSGSSVAGTYTTTRFASVANNYIGIYKGTTVVNFEGNNVISDIAFMVDESGNVFGSTVDVADNNQLYTFIGNTNLSTGALTTNFQLINSEDIIAFTGSPTSGTVARLGTSIAGTYSAVKQ